MSFIQNIRDKYARVSVIAIALALIGFILMDAFTGRSQLFGGGQSTTMGRVNGTRIPSKDFMENVNIQEQNYRAQGQNVETQQLVEGIWNQEVNRIIMEDEFEKLGLTVSDNELTDMLYGAEPHRLAMQYLGNPNGGYDPNQARNIVNQIKKSKNEVQKDQLNTLLNAIEDARLVEKYKTLVAGSVHYAKWFLEKQNIDNSLMGSVSFVLAKDSLISDTAKEVVVTDKDIDDYINKHKNNPQFKLDDETRSIQYVSFSAAPSSADSLAILTQVAGQREKLATTNDTAVLRTFLATDSDFPYDNSFYSAAKIQVSAKDSIFKLSPGAVYGPYLDGNHYVIAKMIAVKQLPDSAKARHILIKTMDPQSGQILVEDSVAKKRADSIMLAIKGGARFDSLAARFSDDQSSAVRGGVVFVQNQQTGDTSDYFPQGAMVRNFNDSIFFGRKGDLKLTKTEFGYHIVEILDQRGVQPNYNIAYLAKEIQTSTETETAAETAALQFAGEARTLKEFDDVYAKKIAAKGITKLTAPDINSHAYYIPSIGQSREFVKAVFDADKDKVLQPIKVGDAFVVAVVTEIAKPGLKTAAMVRRTDGRIVLAIRDKKKGEALKKLVGPVTTLEAASAKLNQPITTIDSVRFNARQAGPNSGFNDIAFEYKVLGAIFNPANKGKVVTEPIKGNRGLYIIRPENVTATAVENADVAALARSMEANMRYRYLMENDPQMQQYGQRSYNPADVLRIAATIKDNRNKFY